MTCILRRNREKGNELRTQYCRQRVCTSHLMLPYWNGGAEFTHLSVVRDSAKFPICHLGGCAPTSATVNYVFLPDEAVVFYVDGNCDVAVTGYSKPFDLGDIDDLEGDSSESESELDPKLAKQPKQKFEISKAKQQKPIIEEPESDEMDLGGEGEAQYSHSGESSKSDSLSECQYGE
ncbi:MAG: hypothetical protein EZS28_038665 [Streblomastix strix]|uniref:Nucleoplasmin-like domain-containing protein n=1 Tax=Streblomastix strix TaxID=222440 RepID=A0A5J4U656_9EUKA|nr:MAG: hypothetical protein EZS28_038665 [Streblomastix strix]